MLRLFPFIFNYKKRRTSKIIIKTKGIKIFMISKERILMNYQGNLGGQVLKYNKSYIIFAT